MCFFVVGIGVIYVAWSVSNKYDRLVKTGLQADGIVFDFESGGADNPDMPVIRFVTNKQEWITKVSNISLPNLKIGGRVTVLYNPENPNDFVVKLAGTNFFVACLAVAGALAVLGGVYYLLMA